MTLSDNSHFLTVHVRNRRIQLFSGRAMAVSSENEKGVFDVLWEHANFISLIKNNISIHLDPTEKRIIPIKSGVMNVSNNTVDIFLDIELSELAY
jgi:F0F1-type ATP synthase epsilon subunit